MLRAEKQVDILGEHPGPATRELVGCRGDQAQALATQTSTKDVPGGTAGCCPVVLVVRAVWEPVLEGRAAEYREDRPEGQSSSWAQ